MPSVVVPSEESRRATLHGAERTAWRHGARGAVGAGSAFQFSGRGPGSRRIPLPRRSGPACGAIRLPPDTPAHGSSSVRKRRTGGRGGRQIYAGSAAGDADNPNLRRFGTENARALRRSGWNRKTSRAARSSNSRSTSRTVSQSGAGPETSFGALRPTPWPAATCSPSTLHSNAPPVPQAAGMRVENHKPTSVAMAPISAM